MHFDALLLLIAYKNSAQKSTEKWSLITLKKDPNLTKKNWLFFWKIIWGISWTLTWAMENLDFDGLLLQKVCIIELKSYREVVSWKITYCFKNDISNLVNIHGTY